MRRVVVILWLAVVACTTQGGSAYGPLVVVDLPDPPGSEALLGTGRLSLEGDCATLERDGASIVLVWEESTVTWDQPMVVYTGGPDEMILRDGDEVTLAGTGLVLDGVTFLREVPDTCDGELGLVSGVTPAG